MNIGLGTLSRRILNGYLIGRKSEHVDQPNVGQRDSQLLVPSSIIVIYFFRYFCSQSADKKSTSLRFNKFESWSWSTLTPGNYPLQLQGWVAFCRMNTCVWIVTQTETRSWMISVQKLELMTAKLPVDWCCKHLKALLNLVGFIVAILGGSVIADKWPCCYYVPWWLMYLNRH